MGVNAVVIAENSRNITLEEFRQAVLDDPDLGRLVWNVLKEDSCLPWKEFEFERLKS